jgi:cytochrome b561
MLFGNIPDIVKRNYSSLVHEVRYSGICAKVAILCIFGGIPIGIGVGLGYISPLWTGLVGALISAMGVLTGFSINAVVLLSNHNEENSYQEKTKVVNQTKDFTLYSILFGVFVLAVLIIGFVTAKAEPIFTIRVPQYIPAITALQGVSAIVYTALIHYLIILLVVSHRLYSLVHGNALNNG